MGCETDGGAGDWLATSGSSSVLDSSRTRSGPLTGGRPMVGLMGAGPMAAGLIGAGAIDAELIGAGLMGAGEIGAGLIGAGLIGGGLIGGVGRWPVRPVGAWIGPVTGRTGSP
jgi:hypothetical protein